MSYLSGIERYHEYRDGIRELLASILTGVSQVNLFAGSQAIRTVMCNVSEHYSFVDLIFTLDKEGVQSSENISCSRKKPLARQDSIGQDRSQRAYFVLASHNESVVVTEPYLSCANRKLCISAARKLTAENGEIFGPIVVNIDLAGTVEFLMGDTSRRRFLAIFRAIYSLIVLGLFALAGLLLFSAFYELSELFYHQHIGDTFQFKPFEVTIFLTLGLAMFELGKIILEEEVLMHKDIFRHSSTRHTITGFIAVILIAVSIEALLMMFKNALAEAESILPALWMMFSANGVLVGLGVDVILGAQAEVKLLNHNAAAK